jgi:hypothetical protein
VKQEPVTEEQEPEEKEGEEELIVRGSTLGLLRQGALGVPEFSMWMESVWFRHVAKPNFLLADSYPVHTAAPTQAALLKVSEIVNCLRGVVL